MLWFRLAWTFGLVSTKQYSTRTRVGRFGPQASDATDAALTRLEHKLFEDRLALILFLVGIVIFAYTFVRDLS